MRVESSVTSVSWIPREAIEGYTRLPWDLGIAHYDLPPPDVLDDLEGLLTSDAARFANQLRGWIEVQDGQITDYGQAGRGHIGNTRMRLAGVRLQFGRSPPRTCGPRLRSGTAGSGSCRPPGVGRGCRCLVVSATGRTCALSGRRCGRRWR
jgi:hypothetical protein